MCSETERRYPKISRPVVVVAGPLARRVSRQKAEKAFWQFAERHFERGTLLIASEKGFRGRFRFHAWLRGVDPASGEVRAVKPDARIVGQRITRVAHREENVALVLDAHRAGIPAWVVHRLRGVPTLTHVEDLLARELRISLREAERLLEQGDSAIGEIFQISRSSRKRQKPSLSTAQRPITGKRGSR